MGVRIQSESVFTFAWNMQKCDPTNTPERTQLSELTRITLVMSEHGRAPGPLGEPLGAGQPTVSQRSVE